MTIEQATADYEAWLARQVTLVQADLARKHTRMARDLFQFLRATFYRWMQHWPVVCADLVNAPQVLAIGDLHVENFGTWRDSEGRLIWGINDFDEACPLPYTNDLVRLATSARFAIDADQLSVGSREACELILEGYLDGLEGGRPFVLAEEHGWLRSLASGRLGERDPARFWERLGDGPVVAPEHVPADAVAALEQLLPERGLACRHLHRVAGLGSLGRQRWLAIAEWRGGKIAREAKALAPPACLWSGASRGPWQTFQPEIVRRAVRVPDPFVQLHERWIVRRLAPDCLRIELGWLPKARDEARMLRAMGKETANVHLGSRQATDAVRQEDGESHCR